jgi:hypothetical protein
MVRRNRGFLFLLVFLTAACGGSIPYSGEFFGGGWFTDGGPPGAGNTGAGEGVISLADAGPHRDAGAASDAGDIDAGAGEGAGADAGVDASQDAGDLANGDGGTDTDAGADSGDDSDADAGAGGDAGIDDNDDNDAGEKLDGGKDKRDRKDRKACPESSKRGRGHGKGCGGQGWPGPT